MDTKEVALICKALGDPNRLQIMQMLTQGEQCACQMLEQFDITQPTLSHHMKVLSECGLITMRKEGKWAYYSINCDTLSAFQCFLGDMICGPWAASKGRCDHTEPESEALMAEKSGLSEEKR